MINQFKLFLDVHDGLEMQTQGKKIRRTKFAIFLLFIVFAFSWIKRFFISKKLKFKPEIIKKYNAKSVNP